MSLKLLCIIAIIAFKLSLPFTSPLSVWSTKSSATALSILLASPVWKALLTISNAARFFCAVESLPVSPLVLGAVLQEEQMQSMPANAIEKILFIKIFFGYSKIKITWLLLKYFSVIFCILNHLEIMHYTELPADIKGRKNPTLYIRNQRIPFCYTPINVAVSSLKAYTKTDLLN